MPKPILWMPAAAALLLAACSTTDRITDSEVRVSDRVECRNARGIPPQVAADGTRASAFSRDCHRDDSLTLWRSDGGRSEQPIDFRRDRDED